MEIKLSPKLEEAVAYGIASGRYANAEEYFAKAVELLHERDAWPEESLEEQRAGLEAAWQEAERGEFFSMDEVRRKMEQMKAEWKASHYAK